MVDRTERLNNMSGSPQDTLEKIKGALYAGRRIEAIKLYREARGLGLKEAKEDLDKLEQELRESSPEKFAAPASKGCLGVILLLASAASICVIGFARLAAE